ncbi:pyrroloquinoline quinone biosynthesis protein PqqB [Ectothiorhodospiraceae bacterium 2226]|nr:pyrroloquinoline quinone biosynthesis protein PqqB [Ectothiorhodospiraceae bacterium 2226]
MKVRVLGSAAGGGFPQWNCNCDNCAGLRAGRLQARARTQSSIAVSGDGRGWLLVNASPDIRAQILATPALQPGAARRDTGIRAVLLVDAQIDHAAGLLMLREHDRPLAVWCTRAVHQDLTTGLPILKVLEHYCGVRWHELAVDGTGFRIPGLDGLEFAAVPVAGKAPPYSPHRDDPHAGDNIALSVRDAASGRSLFYAPGLAEVDARLEAEMARASALLVDGTCWSDDELERRGVGARRATAMGHLPQSGPGGMLEVLERLDGPRKVLIHINNTNPVLAEDGPERGQLAAAGIEVAYDGMELDL